MDVVRPPMARHLSSMVGWSLPYIALQGLRRLAACGISRRKDSISDALHGVADKLARYPLRRVTHGVLGSRLRHPNRKCESKGPSGQMNALYSLSKSISIFGIFLFGLILHFVMNLSRGELFILHFRTIPYPNPSWMILFFLLVECNNMYQN